MLLTGQGGAGYIGHLQEVHTEQGRHDATVQLAHKRYLCRIGFSDRTRIVSVIDWAICLEVFFGWCNIVDLQRRVLFKVCVANVGDGHYRD